MNSSFSSGSRRAPVLFAGHGSPMMAIEDNVWSRGLRALGDSLPRPGAIVSVSAHWFVQGTHVTGDARPKTIHDFGGFPRDLYDVQYAAPGAPQLAVRVAELLRGNRATVTDDWGLDHGTWTVLLHLRPAADIPVLQVSIDATLSPSRHFDLGRALAPLRDDGILLMGSGNFTHNLGHALRQMRAPATPAPEWAATFDSEVARAMEQRDIPFLLKALESPHGRMAHPTPDHYLPLLYVMGASDEKDVLTFPVTGFDLGSLSMRSALLG